MGDAQPKVKYLVEPTQGKLLEGLIKTLSDKNRDIMSDLIVATPTSLTGDLLRLRIAQSKEGLRICSGIAFTSLDALFEQLRWELTKKDSFKQDKWVPTLDPWSSEQLTWRILAAMEDEGLLRRAEKAELSALKSLKDLRAWLGYDDVSGEESASDDSAVVGAACERPDAINEQIVRATFDFLLEDLWLYDFWDYVSYSKAGKVPASGSSEMILKQGPVGLNRDKLLATPSIHDLHERLSATAERLEGLVGDVPESVRADAVADFVAHVVAAVKDLGGTEGLDLQQDVLDYSEVRVGESKVGIGNRDSRQKERLAQLGKAIAGALRAFADDPAKHHYLAVRLEQLIAHWQTIGLDEQTAERRTARDRRLLWAQKTARLLLSYVEQKPDMMDVWKNGDEFSLAGDKELPTYLLWQPVLWKYLAEQCPVIDPASFVLGLDGRIEAIPAMLDRLGLAQVLHVYGYTFVPESQWRLLKALADAGVSVTLWCVGNAHDEEERQTDTDECLSGTQPAANGLAFWDAERRAFLRRSSAEDHAASYAAGVLHMPDMYVHSCIGKQRQTEVLQDLLIDAVDKEKVSPDEIAVVVPDYDAFELLLAGALSHMGDGIEAHPANSLPVWLPRGSERDIEHPLAALLAAFDLFEGRFSQSAMLRLLSLAPVRAHMGWDDTDLGILTELVQSAGVNWGWDETDDQHRFVLPGATGTWTQGLRRLALGLALGEDAPAWRTGDLDQALVAVEGMPTTMVPLLGGVLDLSEQLEGCFRKMCAGEGEDAGRHSLRTWSGLLNELMKLLCGEGSPRDEQLATTRSWVQSLGGAESKEGTANAHDLRSKLSLADIRLLVEERYRRVGRGGRVLPGRVVVCSSEDIAMIPFKRVFLLGVDDVTFPGRERADGDDVLQWLVGRGGTIGVPDCSTLLASRERTVRQRTVLLLGDAERCDLLFEGKSVTTGADREVPVAVVELSEGACPVEHGLFGFLPEGNGMHYTYDARAGQAFKAYAESHGKGLMTDRVQLWDKMGEKVGDMLHYLSQQPQEPTVIDLDGLVTFFEDPPKVFLRSALGIRMPDIETRRNDNLLRTDGLDGLERHALLQAIFRGLDPDANPFERSSFSCYELVMSLLNARPLRRQTEWQVSDVVSRARRMAGTMSGEQFADLWERLHEPMERRHVDFEVGEGLRLVGDIDLVGGCHLVLGAGDEKKGRCLRSWIRLAALIAQDGARATERLCGCYIAATNGKNAVFELVRPPRTRDEAVAVLRDFTCIYRLGMAFPLPFDAQLTHEYYFGKDDKKNASEALPKRYARKYSRDVDALIWGYERDWSSISHLCGPKELERYLRCHLQGLSDADTTCAEGGQSLFCLLAECLWAPYKRTNQNLSQKQAR